MGGLVIYVTGFRLNRTWRDINLLEIYRTKHKALPSRQPLYLLAFRAAAANSLSA